jgi:hypothetical protein
MLRRARGSSATATSSSQVAVHTVDSFQGSEASVVLLSLVRSNKSGDVGFLSDARRLNVAVTRAQDLLLIFGDAATVSDADTGITPANSVVSSMHQDLRSRGHVCSEVNFRSILAQNQSPTKDEFDKYIEREVVGNATRPPIPNESISSQPKLNEFLRPSISTLPKGLKEGFVAHMENEEKLSTKLLRLEGCDVWVDECREIDPPDLLRQHDLPGGFLEEAPSPNLNYQLWDENDVRDAVLSDRSAGLRPRPAEFVNVCKLKGNLVKKKRNWKLDLGWRGPAFVVGKRFFFIWKKRRI